MEFLLNLAWLMVSAGVIFAWVRGIRSRRTSFTWGACVALGLLVLLMLPVISMTDDLVAFSSPAETEHILRRSEAPLAYAASGVLPLHLLAPLGPVSATVGSMPAYARPEPSLAAALRVDFTRALGVRPPPAPGLPPVSL